MRPQLGGHFDAGEGSEPCPRGAVAAVAVGVVNVVQPNSRLLGLGQEQCEWRLVGDEDFHMAGGVGDQGEPRNSTTAAAEHVRGPVANSLDHPAHVIGEEVGLGILLEVVNRAPREAARVVGHDGIVLG